MNRDLWQRVESALQQALALQPAARADFVTAIADAETRTEVASLLAADSDTVEQHLERAISGTANRLIEAQETHPLDSQFSHYRLLQLLGAGGTSKVYLAEDLLLHRKVALKFLPAAFSEDAAKVRRFEREARAASALNHPNIVTTYEIGNVDENWFIAMEYVAGQPLSARLDSGPMPILEALGIAEQVAAALAQSHQSGILHRDIKPQNIMLRADGVVKLLDFGIARLDPQFFEGGQSTYSGTLLGTPAYMSPEQAKGLPLTGASDLWSLGAVLYEMLTGTRAYRGSDTPQVLVAILSRRPPLPSSKLSSIPAAADLLIMKLLSQNPASRYSSAQEVREAIRDLRASVTCGPLRKSWRWISSRFR